MTIWTVARAAAFAQFAHCGQLDKVGRAYTQHVSDVAVRVRHAGGDDSARVVALLHASCQRWPGTQNLLGILDQLDLPNSWLISLDLLTRARGKRTYRILATDRRAHLVAAHDLAANTDPKRLAQLRELDPAAADRIQAHGQQISRWLGLGDLTTWQDGS